MPTPEKRDGKLTGFWYGEVDRRHKPGGQRFRRRFETKAGAVGYEAYVKATGMEDPSLNDAKLTGPTFKQAAADMRAHRKGQRDPSGELRLDWIIDHLGHLTFPAITTTTLDGLVEALEARKSRKAGVVGGGTMSDSTINRYLTAFSGVRTFAVARVKPNETPLPALVIPWRKEKGQRIHWFSQEQEDVLVSWLINEKLSPAVALSLRVLCATGMRWSEFADLEPHQCQPEWVLLDDTKTDTPRDIPIDEELARELKAMVVTKTIPNYYTMRRYLAAAVKACGYSPKLGIHNARHATATRLVKNGENIPIVQKFLGHKSSRTTEKYTHVEADDLMKAMRNLRPCRGETSENVGGSQVLPFMKSTG